MLNETLEGHMRRVRRAALVVVAALAVAWSAAPQNAVADEPAPIPAPAEKDVPPEKPTVDAADVYLGNAANFAKPAEVDASSVYGEIPEYKRIRDESIEPGTAEYDLLMSKASRKFHKALRAAQKDGGYDLVARSGTVHGVDSVPDITADAIAKL